MGEMLWFNIEAVSHLHKLNQKSFTRLHPEYMTGIKPNLWITSALHVWTDLPACAVGVHLICLCPYVGARDPRLGKGVEEKEKMKLWAGPRNSCFP